MTIKTRFAPSPTGYMHLGNARTALFNALLAQAQGGQFLVRIEDTDKERSEENYTDALLKDLTWLGIEWQEGPEVGGPHAPYSQMLRLDIYEHYYQRLIQEGQAYPCYCNEQELSMVRKAQTAAGMTPRYPGTCRHLTSAQIEKKEREGRVPCLRLKVPDNAHVRFQDLIYGMKDFKAADLGDFVIRKEDNGPTFMFANAIDDALMEVTHALRGEDHLTNTPRQILLLNLLGLTPPNYGHFPIILGQDGKPLSKRNGSQSIQLLREQGYHPEGIVNYMARLGHHYTSDTWMDYQTLGKNFSLEGIGRSAARYDLEQLNFWQKQTVAKCTVPQMMDWLKSSLPNEQHLDKLVPVVRDNIILPVDAIAWSESLNQVGYTFEGEALEWIQKTSPEYWKVAIHALKVHGPDAKMMTDILKKELDVHGKALFMPLRLSLTGQLHGPQLVEILNYLGPVLGEQKLQAMITHENL